MGDLENKAGLLLAAIVIFIFLMVVAFIKRDGLEKTNETKNKDTQQSRDVKK